MPHVATSDSHLHPWTPTTVAQRTLPPPPTFDPYHKNAFGYNNGPPTPPPTTEMNGLPPLPIHGQRPQEMSYPVRLHAPSQAPASMYGAGPVPTTSNSNVYLKSSPPTITTLAQAEPDERSSPSNTHISSPAFKLPSTIKVPQENLPQLAAEVSLSPRQCQGRKIQQG